MTPQTASVRAEALAILARLGVDERAFAPKRVLAPEALAAASPITG